MGPHFEGPECFIEGSPVTRMMLVLVIAVLRFIPVILVAIVRTIRPSRVSGSHAREVCGNWAFRFIQALANHIRASTTFGNSETRDNELRRWEVRDLCARVLRPVCVVRPMHPAGMMSRRSCYRSIWTAEASSEYQALQRPYKRWLASVDAADS